MADESNIVREVAVILEASGLSLVLARAIARDVQHRVDLASAKVRPEHLDRDAKAICAAIGWDAFASLVFALGGTRVYVPDPERGRKGWDRIVDVVGEQAARKLAEVYAGVYIRPPTVEQVAHRARRAMVETLLAQGRSPSAIARALGMGERTVTDIRTRAG